MPLHTNMHACTHTYRDACISMYISMCMCKRERERLVFLSAFLHLIFGIFKDNSEKLIITRLELDEDEDDGSFSLFETSGAGYTVEEAVANIKETDKRVIEVFNEYDK